MKGHEESSLWAGLSKTKKRLGKSVGPDIALIFSIPQIKSMLLRQERTRLKDLEFKIVQFFTGFCSQAVNRYY